MISLPLISRGRRCTPHSPPASLAFIDSPLIQLEGEVRSNGINDGVRTLLAAACHGKVTGRDPRPGLAIPAPSMGAGLGDGDLPCHWDPCIEAWHPGTHLFRCPRASDRDLANPRLPPSLPPGRCSLCFAGRAIRPGALSKLAVGMGSGEVALAAYCCVPAPGLASLVRLTRAASIPLPRYEEVSGGVPVPFPIAASLTPSASSSPVPLHFITPPAPTSAELLQHQSRGEVAPRPTTLPASPGNSIMQNATV